MMIYPSLSTAWASETERVLGFGEESSPRGMKTRELRWGQFAIDYPLTFPLRVEGRDFVDVIAILEATSLVGQFSVPELFTDRIRKFAEFTDAGVFHGSYGARVHGRLGDLVDLLKRDPDTRQAILTIYDSRSDLGVAKTDVPCTLSIHFMRRGRELEMRVTMRSNDAWLGLPYDLVQFAVLQASIAQALGLIPGTYVHSTGSLHLYERDFDKVRKIGAFQSPASVMNFPLWDCASDIGLISRRAREIAMGIAYVEVTDDRRYLAGTQFEEWAAGELSDAR